LRVFTFCSVSIALSSSYKSKTWFYRIGFSFFEDKAASIIAKQRYSGEDGIFQQYFNQLQAAIAWIS